MKRRPRVGLHVFMVLICLFSLFPFVWMITTSLKPVGEIHAIPPTMLPKTVTVESYGNVFTKSNIPRYFINSTIISTGSTVIALAFAVLAGYGFSRFRFKGKRALQNAVLSAQMMPTAAIIVPLFIILRSLGLLNTYLGLILAYLIITLPLSVWMMTGYIHSIPVEIEEAATIDGCNPIQTFFLVVFPILKPIYITVAILNTMWIWNDYLLPYLVIGSNYRTIPIAVQYLQGGYGSRDMGAMMAMLVLAIVPIIIFYFSSQKYIIEGVVAGAVKG